VEAGVKQALVDRTSSWTVLKEDQLLVLLVNYLVLKDSYHYALEAELVTALKD